MSEGKVGTRPAPTIAVNVPGGRHFVEMLGHPHKTQKPQAITNAIIILVANLIGESIKAAIQMVKVTRSITGQD